MDLVRIASVAAQECVKQEVGVNELSNLLAAYNYVSQMGIEDRFDFFTIGRMIEPSNGNCFRHIPVIFKSGGTSASPQEIPRLMTTLIEHIQYYQRQHPVNQTVLRERLVKDFLWIHPFIDGNGRTAWILWNWLNGTMDSPTNLPDFFGE